MHAGSLVCRGPGTLGHAAAGRPGGRVVRDRDGLSQLSGGLTETRNSESEPIGLGIYSESALSSAVVYLKDPDRRGRGRPPGRARPGVSVKLHCELVVRVLARAGTVTDSAMPGPGQGIMMPAS